MWQNDLYCFCIGIVMDLPNVLTDLQMMILVCAMTVECILRIPVLLRRQCITVHLQHLHHHTCLIYSRSGFISCITELDIIDISPLRWYLTAKCTERLYVCWWLKRLVEICFFNP